MLLEIMIFYLVMKMSKKLKIKIEIDKDTLEPKVDLAGNLEVDIFTIIKLMDTLNIMNQTLLEYLLELVIKIGKEYILKDEND